MTGCCHLDQYDYESVTHTNWRLRNNSVAMLDWCQLHDRTTSRQL